MSASIATADQSLAAHAGPVNLTPTQLAQRWSVTVGHLANLRFQGEGVSYLKLGGRVLYRVADVEAFEQGCYIGVGRSSMDNKAVTL